MNKAMTNPELLSLHESVSQHTMFAAIKNLTDLKTMMETHVFAVWDFMSLLKRLQREITCVQVPWKPSPYPKKMVRLINEIVLGEESDLLQSGEPMDHFSLYLESMKELGASTERIKLFLVNDDYSLLSHAEKNFVQFNIDLAKNGKVHEVAAAFFFGREKLIPDMFTSILKDLDRNLDLKDQNSFPYMRYYLERHIEIDGGEHSHLAHECLNVLCGNDEEKWLEAERAGIHSLKLRSALWDHVETMLS
jgi:hypothetical protein